ncbi:hypothetical protein NUW58_g7644 [Xylaria curta]|uniref:Uncharacterized protein n=1 Tax=Xylaria curta TaxID=42375 RepID=A0ACC1NFA8_9PEZI|nr:hypothetical protein NUW58_g7644 [Xylaria curta]
MDVYNDARCPVYASFFGVMGCAASIIFTVIGASYGTAKSAGAIFSSGIIRPDRLMQNTYIHPSFLSDIRASSLVLIRDMALPTGRGPRPPPEENPTTNPAVLDYARSWRKSCPSTA